MLVVVVGRRAAARLRAAPRRERPHPRPGRAAVALLPALRRRRPARRAGAAGRHPRRARHLDQRGRAGRRSAQESQPVAVVVTTHAARESERAGGARATSTSCRRCVEPTRLLRIFDELTQSSPGPRHLRRHRSDGRGQLRRLPALLRGRRAPSGLRQRGTRLQGARGGRASCCRSSRRTALPASRRATTTCSTSTPRPRVRAASLRFTLRDRARARRRALVRGLDHARLHRRRTARSDALRRELLDAVTDEPYHRRAYMEMDRNLALEVVRVTEAAALVVRALDGTRRRQGRRPGRGRGDAPRLRRRATSAAPSSSARASATRRRCCSSASRSAPAGTTATATAPQGRHRGRSARGHEPVRDRRARRDRGHRDRRRRQVPERARHVHGEDRRRAGGQRRASTSRKSPTWNLQRARRGQARARSRT